MRKFILCLLFVLSLSLNHVFAQDPGAPCNPDMIEDPPGSGNCVYIETPIDNKYVLVGMMLFTVYLFSRYASKKSEIEPVD